MIFNSYSDGCSYGRGNRKPWIDLLLMELQRTNSLLIGHAMCTMIEHTVNFNG